MKLSFVTPRFGKDIVGGAEFAIGQLAKNCVEFGDVQAEILTTTAGDERTWSQKYDVGSETIDGVVVKRFANKAIVRSEFDLWSQKHLTNPEKMTVDDFEEWLVRQGPYSPDLLNAIENCESQAVVFHPMLSSPTSHGIFRAKVPSVLHPALHDEPLARMPGYKKVVNHASFLSFSTVSEQKLSSELYGSQLSKQAVLGFGIDSLLTAGKHEAESILNRFALENEQYFIVVGRVDPGKGSDLVADFFEEFLKHDKSKKLVFVGPVSQTSKLFDQDFLSRNSDSIIVTGMLDDGDKNTLISNACALITPSATESFSLVVLEAMKLKTAVIVNKACGPTLEHVQLSNSGYFFEDYASFHSCLALASTKSNENEVRVDNGFKYVEDKYSWRNIIERYIKIIKTL